MTQLSKSPVMGVWMMGISRSTKNKPEAIRLVLYMTIHQELQYRLASDGAIPVIRYFSNKDKLLKNSPFWVNNFNTIEEALKTAKPRPRTSKWWEIEHELGKNLRSSVFDPKQDFEKLSSGSKLYNLFGDDCKN
jgi:maltose-binding protein MalE